jgi:hypothetical protein
LVNATYIDLAWYVDRVGNLNAFVGSQLVGAIPQSGTGAVSSVTGVTTLPVAGRVLQVTGLALTTANLSPILGVQTGAVAAKTMTVDFICAQKER